MKAINYIWIMSAMMLTGLTAEGQISAGIGVTVNHSYSVDYDFHYSSRINRFHRSYTTFSYYSPVYTETYWYTYSPYSWGVSIYGNDVVGIGYSGYPVYAMGYGGYGGYSGYYGNAYVYDYGFYSPYYDPYYYRAFSPVIVRVTVKSKNYYTWNRHYYTVPQKVYSVSYNNSSPAWSANTPETPVRNMRSQSTMRTQTQTSSQGRNGNATSRSVSTSTATRPTTGSAVQGSQVNRNVSTATRPTTGSAVQGSQVNRNVSTATRATNSNTTVSTRNSSSRQSNPVSGILRNITNRNTNTGSSQNNRTTTSTTSTSTTRSTVNRSSTVLPGSDARESSSGSSGTTTRGR